MTNEKANKVRDLIANSGLTRAEVAARLGVSLRSVQNWVDSDYTGRVPDLAVRELERLAK